MLNTNIKTEFDQEKIFRNEKVTRINRNLINENRKETIIIIIKFRF